MASFPDLYLSSVCRKESERQRSRPIEKPTAHPPRNPKLARALVAAGLSHYQTGRVRDAAQAMDEALLACPGHREALRHRALLAHLQGSAVSARAALRRLVESEPGDAAARLALAFVLTEDGDVGDALGVLRAAPPGGPDGVAWRALRAWALLESDQAGAARAELDRIGTPRGDAGLLAAWGRLLLAWQAGETQECATRAEALAMQAADPAQGSLAQRVSVQFNLGRFYRQVGWPKRAFGHAQAGHALLRNAQPFDRPAHAQLIEATMAAYSCAARRSAATASVSHPMAASVMPRPNHIAALCGRAAIMGASMSRAPATSPACRRATAKGSAAEAGDGSGLATFRPVSNTIPHLPAPH